MSTKDEVAKGTTVTPPRDSEKSANALAGQLQVLDAERQTLVESTVARLTAGNAADKDAYRRIKAIDTQRSRLLVARFAELLREGSPRAKPIVEQLLKA